MTTAIATRKTATPAASLARVVGPAIAGLLYDVRAALAFGLAALLLLAVAYLARGFPERAADSVAGVQPVL